MKEKTKEGRKEKHSRNERAQQNAGLKSDGRNEKTTKQKMMRMGMDDGGSQGKSITIGKDASNGRGEEGT